MEAEPYKDAANIQLPRVRALRKRRAMADIPSVCKNARVPASRLTRRGAVVSTVEDPSVSFGRMRISFGGRVINEIRVAQHDGLIDFTGS